MSPSDWTSVSVSKDMVEKIRKLIEENPDLGYRSLSDFVQDAVRRHPEYVEQFEHFNIWKIQEGVVLRGPS